ncbi:MAG: porin [Armatimonadota bacterium]|nr:porin [Armatimonadota bacterium]
MKFALTVLLLSKSAAAFCQADQDVPPPSGDLAEIRTELEQLREIVTDPEGAIQTAVTDTNRLKKIKFSGYVQANYINQQGGAGPGSATKNQWNVRRARLKAVASPAPHTSITLQADFGGTSPSLKDAYVDWFPLAADAEASWMLSVGQLKWPFGYEGPQSSSVRDTPERSLVVSQLLPGERDRGVVITSPQTYPVWMQVGLFNGVGANKNDDNNEKDVAGRVRWAPLPSLDLGASFYYGRHLAQAPAAAVAAGKPTNVFQDTNKNGVQDSDEPTIGVIAGTAAVPAKPAIEHAKTRYGVDAQWIPINNLSLKGEYIAGKQTVSASKPPVNAHGYWLQTAYALGPRNTVVVKFDSYRDSTVGNSKDIWHVGLIRYLTDATRLRLFYQFVRDPLQNDPKKRDNNTAVVDVISLF